MAKRAKPFRLEDKDWMEFQARLEATTLQFVDPKGMTFQESFEGLQIIAALWFRIQMAMNDTCILVKSIANGETQAEAAPADAQPGLSVLKQMASKIDEIMTKARKDEYKSFDQPVREFRLFLETFAKKPT